MTKRLLLGFGTILTGWCLSAFGIAALSAIPFSTAVLSALAIVLVLAMVIGWLWVGAVQTQAAEAPSTAVSDYGQARNHGVALLCVGVLLGGIVSGLVALFSSTAFAGLSTALLVGVVASGGLAPAWKYNCAPEWLDG